MICYKDLFCVCSIHYILFAISCLWTENSLIERAKEMSMDLQNAVDDINLLSSKLGMIIYLLILRQ